MLLLPDQVDIPSPPVTIEGAVPRLLPLAAPRRALRHAVVVDAGAPADPDDPTPCPQVLADHLMLRASAVDLLTGAGPLPRHPDLVVGFTSRPAGAGTATDLSRSCGAPLVLVVHELGAADAARERRALRAADVVAITSEAFRGPVRERGVADGRIAVLPDWAHVVPTWLDRREARRALGWPERAFVAVHAGMTRRQDPAVLVEAARRAGPDVLVALVGAGPRADQVRDLAAGLPNVLFTGALEAERRALTLVAADVLVLSESLGPGQLVLPPDLGSCLVAARPVVAAAVPGGVTQAELARAHGAGLVVPAGAADLVAEALLTLRADPGRRVAMGLAALAHAEVQLTLPHSLACFDGIVDAALSRPSARRCGQARTA